MAKKKNMKLESGKVCLHDWYLPEMEKKLEETFKSLVLVAAAEALDCELKNKEGGPLVCVRSKGPLTIEFVLGMGEDDDPLVWTRTLREMVDIDCDEIIENEDAEVAIKELRDLADLIEQKTKEFDDAHKK